MTQLFLEATHDTFTVPLRATKHAACWDIHANITGRTITSYARNNTKVIASDPKDYFNLFPGERAMIPTGFKMTTEPGYCIKIYPRSGTALKYGVNLINNIAVIDRDYAHEVFILLHNNTDNLFIVKHGDRIAQLAVEKVIDIQMTVLDKLPEIESNRTGGFNSTGK